uniref:Photosystem II reaction center PsbP family protein n=1 Tax=Apostasia odorata TaxID=280455 RepID=A0A0F7CYL2_9ASPA
MAAIPLLVCLPPRNPNPTSRFCFTTGSLCCCFSRRKVILTAAVAVTLPGSGKASSSAKTAFDGISNTKSWFQFYGDGFSIRVPPLFEDIMEPEDFSAGQTFYGDKAKPKTFAARFASLDRSEVLSVMIRPSNQLKITFLEAKDITDIGSLKESSKIFVPGGAKLYSARSYKVKDDEMPRTYYFYEFGLEGQHVALAAGISSGKAYVAGAAAPQAKWEDDGVVLRSAALSLTVL